MTTINNTSEDDSDPDSVLLICTDPNKPDEEPDCTEITILTSEITTWDLTEILSHHVVTVKANRNRLIQHSSYFRGLLCGSFSESRLDCVTVRWDLETLISILKFMFTFSVVITSNNLLPLFEGSLFFGVETLLSKCKAWLIEETTPKCLPLMNIQLDDLINIWSFSVEHDLAIDLIPQHCSSYLARNFMFAICCKSFPKVPSKLLLSCIKHPDLTVESERHLAKAIMSWITANAEPYEGSSSINDNYIIYLKEIRISLLPLWFVAGERRCRYFSNIAEESIIAILNLMSHPLSMKNDSADTETRHLKIRLSQYTKKINLSGCPQMKSKYLLEAMISSPYSIKSILTPSTEQISRNTEQVEYKYLNKSDFEALEEVEISNCPGLNLEATLNCFCKSFLSLRVLKAAHYLDFNQKNLGKLLMIFPLLTELDLTVDTSPLVPSNASSVSSGSEITSPVPTEPLGNRFFSPGSGFFYMSAPMHINLSKLTLEGRVDVTDNVLKIISSFCASLSYLNVRGCTSVTDTGISVLIRTCLKLHSLVACNTSFGFNSISALMSEDLHWPFKSDIGEDHSISRALKVQELHIGGCKGFNSASLSKLISHTPKLKSLCVREMQSVDEALYSFLGSSLEMLDLTDTKVSSAALTHIVSRNPGLKCLRAKGCTNLYHQSDATKHGNSSSLGYSCEWYMKVKTCKLEEIALGWGFSHFSIEAMRPAIASLTSINVGLGATLGPVALELLPIVCPLLESVMLYFQVISDSVVKSLMVSLRNLQILALCHCLGDISPASFKFTMPNLRKLQLERVTPWMINDDLATLVENCPSMVEIFLSGCRLLDPDSQKIISSGWPGLISIHLEDCGEVTVNGVSSLLECIAVEDILLRHNGPGIQRNFILHASAVMPMLRKVSIDECDSVEGDFDMPNFDDRRHLSFVKVARCKPQRCGLGLKKICKQTVHKKTLVMVWDSEALTRVVVKERC